MKKISDAVKETLLSSEIATTALVEGYLNLSAYAKTIHLQVEELTKKDVKLGSIVVALTRLVKSLQREAGKLVPEIGVKRISVKSNLVELTFHKTGEIQEKLPALYQQKNLKEADFFTTTVGIGEISIIVSYLLVPRVLSLFKGLKPLLYLEDLVGLTIHFDEKCIETPNIIYVLTRKLALKSINIVEIVSTYTEITFVLHQKDLEQAFLVVNTIYQR